VHRRREARSHDGLITRAGLLKQGLGTPIAPPNPSLGPAFIDRDYTVTRKNYSFEKRQRELAKKKKKEDKRQQKAEAQQLKAGGEAIADQPASVTDDDQGTEA